MIPLVGVSGSASWISNYLGTYEFLHFACGSSKCLLLPYWPTPKIFCIIHYLHGHLVSQTCPGFSPGPRDHSANLFIYSNINHSGMTFITLSLRGRYRYFLFPTIGTMGLYNSRPWIQVLPHVDSGIHHLMQGFLVIRLGMNIFWNKLCTHIVNSCHAPRKFDSHRQFPTCTK